MAPAAADPRLALLRQITAAQGAFEPARAALTACFEAGWASAPPEIVTPPGVDLLLDPVPRAAGVWLWEEGAPRRHDFTWTELRTRWTGILQHDVCLLGPWLRVWRPPMTFFTGAGQSYMDNPFEANCLGRFAERLLRRDLTPARRIAAPVVLLSEGLWSNWFHWLLDHLPRLARLDRRQPDWRVAIPAQAPRFIADSLALLGLSDRIERIGDDIVACDHLVTPAPFVDRPQAAWDAVPWLRDVFAPWIVAAQAEVTRGLRPPRRLWITRRHAPSRRLCGEEQLEAYLAPLGFETLALEHLPPLEQIRAFAQAELIVAPHGAGLTNIAFCAPGARVVEITPRTDPNRYFHQSFPQISACLGLDHHILLTAGWENDDMSVSPEALLAALSFSGS